jgi:hypothetical protein
MMGILVRTSLAAFFFGCSFFLFSGWYELQQIKGFAQKGVTVEGQSFRNRVEDLVSATSFLIEQDTIRFPLLTSFTRLGKRFKHGLHADCGDASELCAELADSFALDVRMIQMLDEECNDAKHVLILASQGDSVFLLADPLFGYVFADGFNPLDDIDTIIAFWEQSLQKVPNERVARYRPTCGFRVTNYSRLGLSRDHVLVEVLEQTLFSFARYKAQVRLLLSVLFFFGGSYLLSKDIKNAARFD